MNADQVRAYAQAKWPEAMKSPLAVAINSIVASDEIRSAAYEHAVACITACDGMGIEYDEETIAGNVESNFPELSADECDAIAHRAMLSS